MRFGFPAGWVECPSLTHLFASYIEALSLLALNKLETTNWRLDCTGIWVRTHTRGGQPMEVAIQYLGESRFSAQARGHTILADEPYDNGGTDTAMTPSELLLASLGTCTGYYAAQYLRARDLPAEGLKLSVRAEKGAQPARFSEFQVTVSVADLEERHADALLRAIKACMVHHTLQHQPHVRFEVVIGTPSHLAVES